MNKHSKFLQKSLKLFGVWAIALTVIVALGSPTTPLSGSVQASEPLSITAHVNNPLELVQQGRQHYRDGYWQEALEVWQQAEDIYQDQRDSLNQAMVLSNVALAYQSLDQISEAQQAITASLDLLQSAAPTGERSRILAQALNTEAGLQLATGQAQQALMTWERATDLYRQLGEDAGVVQCLVNQAQALRKLGFYRRAQSLLEQVTEQLAEQPDSLTKAAGLYSLGNMLRLNGQLEASRTALEKSLAIARTLNSQPDISAALMSLGNTARVSDQRAEARAFYQQTADNATDSTQYFQALDNQLAMSIALQEVNNSRALWPQMYEQVEQLPLNRASLYAQISFAQNLMKLRELKPVDSTDEGFADLATIAQLLADVAQRAEILSDLRAKSYALGYLGNLYEFTQQPEEAQKATNQALALALQLPSSADIAYRWHWQLGRIFKAKGERQSAIAAYTEAISSLQTIRQDLAVVDTDIQFSFKEGVEPVYRELVALLLQDAEAVADPAGTLEKAREVIESLQIAELDDFFKQACVEVATVVADEVDPKTALIYAILLENEIEVVVRLPNQGLYHHTTTLEKGELDRTLDQLKKVLVEDPVKRGRFRTDVLLPLSQKLYDWLLRPAESYLSESSGIETIAFVLDGPLRNIPMALLHDGNHYLIEEYSVALSPGLQLINPQPLPRSELRALAAGLSQRVSSNFSELPKVADELEAVHSQIPDTKHFVRSGFY
ncbi:MAG: tetratricopeptide repeat protein [Leptolyngbya sp. SIOISBB]|nr:tetratricopeptide repeat protein [Leptolyngbya sp. SIOISBB]